MWEPKNPRAWLLIMPAAFIVGEFLAWGVVDDDPLSHPNELFQRTLFGVVVGAIAMAGARRRQKR